MLQVDLTKTDLELSRFITARCSAFGIVRSVNIHHSPGSYALVEMATHFEALELAAQYGGSAFGCSALIHLEQEGLTV